MSSRSLNGSDMSRPLPGQPLPLPALFIEVTVYPVISHSVTQPMQWVKNPALDALWHHVGVIMAAAACIGRVAHRTPCMLSYVEFHGGAFVYALPRRTATICARMASAISSGVCAPMLMPMGPWMRPICSSVTPASRSRRSRRSRVPRLPIAPT